MSTESTSRWDRVLGYSDLTSTGRRIWRALLAEFVGTLFLVLIACGSCVVTKWTPGDPTALKDASKWEEYEPAVVRIALAFGLSVATVVQCIGHVSGGHVNPAVTCAMLVTGKMALLRALFYIIVQCLGAMVGAGILRALTPDKLHIYMGATTISEDLNPVQGFGVEFLITFVLVFTVFAVCDGNRNDVKGSAPLAIGLSVAMCHLFAIKYTGASMNSARSIGPAVVMNQWEHHWVYWLGPCIGGMTAGILYQTAFSATPPDDGKEGVYFMQLKSRDGNAAEKEGVV